jgi:ribonuclease P protein component
MFLGKIKKSHEFSSVFKTGKYLKISSLVIQYKRNSFKDANYSSRYGIVVSKKVGNAVQRNFIKRRIRALLNNISFSFEKKSVDYVFVARKNLIKIKFSALYIELCDALKKINQSGT